MAKIGKRLNKEERRVTVSVTIVVETDIILDEGEDVVCAKQKAIQEVNYELKHGFLFAIEGELKSVSANVQTDTKGPLYIVYFIKGNTKSEPMTYSEAVKAMGYYLTHEPKIVKTDTGFDIIYYNEKAGELIKIN